MPKATIINFDPARIPDTEEEASFHADATYVFSHMSAEVIPKINQNLDWIDAALAGDTQTIIASLNAILSGAAKIPQIVMGSGSATNWDGIKYDEGENSFSFFADQAPDTDTPVFTIDKDRGVFYGGERLWNASNLNIEGTSGQILRKLTPRGGAGFGVDDAVVLGSGDSVATTASNIDGTAEVAYVTSDNDVFIYTNMQGGWESRKTFRFTESGQLLIDGSSVFDASQLNAGIIPSARLSGSYDISATKLGGTVAADFYHGNKSNPKLRMGSDGEGNFDGFLYDEASNVYVLVADGPNDGTSVGNSQLHVGKIRIKHTYDVSGTSTGHPFEIGVPGNRVMIDTNEIAWDSGDGYRNVGLASLVNAARLTGRTWEAIPFAGAIRFDAGCVCTGFKSDGGGQITYLEYSQMQIKQNGQWVNVTGN